MTGAGSNPLFGVVSGSYIYLAGNYQDGTNLSKITQTASKKKKNLVSCNYSFDKITILRPH